MWILYAILFKRVTGFSIEDVYTLSITSFNINQDFKQRMNFNNRKK